MSWRRKYVDVVLALLTIGAGLGLGGISFRWYTAPYDVTGKAIAWTVGMPEPAYNFDTVVPGRLYRSALPDGRLLEYMRRRYRIQHIISLVGESEIHKIAKRLGMNVTVLDWRTIERPVEDLRMLLQLFDRGEPVLLHCKAGRDRSGYAIAVYRVHREHWPIERAVREMEAHGHSKSHHLETVRMLRESVGQLTGQVLQQ